MDSPVRSNVVREGFVAVPGGRVWFQIVGDGAARPLLVLHGGPGYPHDYLKPLAALADERPVVFYDQLGCGRSDRPDDPALWRTERFVDELAIVRRELALESVHILGHSWGSMLATDHALSRPGGLVSLVLASPPLSIPRWLADAARYRAALPASIRETLDHHERAGTTDAPEYEKATAYYYARHVCRVDPQPGPLTRATAALGRPVYLEMWGPNEFFMTGNLREYDRSDRLAEIAPPTLFTCGRFDEAPPPTTAWYASLVPNAEVAVFESSSHMPHLEEQAAYLDTIRAFLARVEAKQHR